MNLFGIDLPVENSAVQLLVSVGAVGCALVALALITALVRTVRLQRWELFAALPAYLVSALSFNAWDSNPSSLLPLGLLLFLTWLPATAAEITRSWSTTLRTSPFRSRSTMRSSTTPGIAATPARLSG